MKKQSERRRLGTMLLDAEMYHEFFDSLEIESIVKLRRFVEDCLKHKSPIHGIEPGLFTRNNFLECDIVNSTLGSDGHQWIGERWISKQCASDLNTDDTINHGVFNTGELDLF
jgi:hypothetical protein